MKNTVSSLLCCAFAFLLCEEIASGTGNVDKKARRDEVLEMFGHAYDSYMTYAYPADELMPLSCKGRVRGREPNRGDVDDSLGNFSLTLIDTLDSLAVLGLLDEFEDAVKKVIADVTFNTDVVVSVFETNIRVVGGLLGGHIAAIDLQEHRGIMEWYKDELLQMAKEVGYRLLPAFNTTTGVPYPKVNLRHGLGKGRSERDTCTACAGTMLLEFSTLSRLSGDPIFEEKARSVMQTLWSKRQRTSNLVGTVINIHTGDWVRRESGVGAGIDSYYEYLLKGYILLGDDSYLDKFNTHYEAIQRYISDGPLLMDVQMHRPHARSRNFMDALLAFWPGLQVLFGDIEPAIETHEMLYQVTQRHNFLPEAFTPQYDVYWGQHPLRPEFIESTYMLYKATSDPYYLEVGEKIIEALQNHARVHCGFAGIKDVRTGSHEDRMDSFVLAETFKYLYLLFAEPEDLTINVDNYLFTTEAHLLPLSLSKFKSDQSNASLHFNATSEADEGLTTSVVLDRSCANHKYLFPGGSTYAQALRDPLKKAKNVQNSQCPSSQQPSSSVSNAPRLKAAEFVPGNPDHMQQLNKMGIRLLTMKDGRVQLMHTATNAVTTQAAEQGALFMQEMIELSKSQQAEGTMQGKCFKMFLLLEALIALSNTSKHQSSNISCTSLFFWSPAYIAIQARNLQKFGAHGGIVIDNVADTSSDTSSMFAMSGDGTDDVNIPMVFLFSKEGKLLLDAIQEHGVVEVLLLDKAKTLSELNEIWGHYHNKDPSSSPFQIRAKVEGVQVSPIAEEEQTHFIDLDDETYDEDGDEEYECRATNIANVIDQGGSPSGSADQSVDTKQQLFNYLQEITHFALTKSDINKLVSQLQNVEGLGEDFKEVVNDKLEKIMKEYENVNGEFRVRVEQSGNGAIFESSASPSQLQVAFDTVWKQYLETEDGKTLQAKRADSAFKHKIDSYNNFQVNTDLLDAIGNVPKETIERIVQDYVKYENIRLQYDEANPIHNMGDNQHIAPPGSPLKSNQDISRTKPSSDGIIVGEVDRDNSNAGASSKSGTTSENAQSGSHISKQSLHEGDEAAAVDGSTVDSQSSEAAQELLQQHNERQQQVETDQDNVDRTRLAENPEQPSRDEL
nr:ER degradation-enhancing alpha-mannosidase-like protein 3 [Lytechinus pictus]